MDTALPDDAARPGAPASDRDAATIGGTLCLMSCYAQHAHPAYADRTACNLEALAASASVSAEFATVCGRLARRWRGLHDEARRASAVEPPRDRRTLQ